MILGCVHPHGIPKKTHPLLMSQARQAKLRLTKRVREGSITLDDYDAQSLEVARKVGTRLLMIRIDHLARDDYVCNPLWSDLVIDVGDELCCSRLRSIKFFRLFHTCDGQCSLS